MLPEPRRRQRNDNPGWGNKGPLIWRNLPRGPFFAGPVASALPDGSTKEATTTTKKHTLPRRRKFPKIQKFPFEIRVPHTQNHFRHTGRTLWQRFHALGRKTGRELVLQQRFSLGTVENRVFPLSWPAPHLRWWRRQEPKGGHRKYLSNFSLNTGKPASNQSQTSSTCKT